jgi:hypothetical protein
MPKSLDVYLQSELVGPSLRQCFELLRKVSSAPVTEVAGLLDAVIFNYLVGNNDAHGKNFSLLYRGIGTDHLHVGLAPLYDLLSTVYYPEISRTMAMKLGGEYSSDKVWPHHFEQLAEDAGLAKPLVTGRVAEMIDEIRNVLLKCTPTRQPGRLPPTFWSAASCSEDGFGDSNALQHNAFHYVKSNIMLNISLYCV